MRSFKFLVLSLAIAGAAQAKPREGLGLISSSLISLGTLYLGNVGTATVSLAVSGSFENSSLNALYIPIAGPFIALGDPRNAPAISSVPLVLDCIAYVAAVTVVVVAIVMEHLVGSMPRAWLLAPGAPRAAAGATFILQLP